MAQYNIEHSFGDLFTKFCSSSTIHGTYFWSEAKTPIARLVWGVIVLMGIFSATFIINSSFKAWQDHPVVTSVMQKSIEEIEFPAITLCPMDDTRWGGEENEFWVLKTWGGTYELIVLFLVILIQWMFFGKVFSRANK